MRCMISFRIASCIVDFSTEASNDPDQNAAVNAPSKTKAHIPYLISVSHSVTLRAKHAMRARCHRPALDYPRLDALAQNLGDRGQQQQKKQMRQGKAPSTESAFVAAQPGVMRRAWAVVTSSPDVSRICLPRDSKAPQSVSRLGLSVTSEIGR